MARRSGNAAPGVTGKKVSVWWVIADEPLSRLFCWGEGQRFALMRCLMDDRMAWNELPCTEEGVTCFEPESMPCALAVFEENMPGIMVVLRANGVRGRYRKAGDDREYRF